MKVFDVVFVDSPTVTVFAEDKDFASLIAVRTTNKLKDSKTGIKWGDKGALIVTNETPKVSLNDIFNVVLLRDRVAS